MTPQERLEALAQSCVDELGFVPDGDDVIALRRDQFYGVHDFAMRMYCLAKGIDIYGD